MCCDLRHAPPRTFGLRPPASRSDTEAALRADTEGHGKTDGPFKNYLHGKLGLLVNYGTCPKPVAEQWADRGDLPFRVFPCVAKAGLVAEEGAARDHGNAAGLPSGVPPPEMARQRIGLKVA